ncbi:hypothetical protein JHK85_006688 [Glycine max]|nr:hypothetical protein JHK85_006688 [Glycine max]KAG5071290.1 hypothetical protein JHK86_006501 [Glycine max]
MKGGEHKYGFNNNKREKPQKVRLVDDETGDKHELFDCSYIKLYKMESISIKRVHGLAKILGSVLSLVGAITFALVKGPHLGFMKWYLENQNHTSYPLTIVHSKGDTIRGSLLMLSANTAWSLWVISIE